MQLLALTRLLWCVTAWRSLPRLRAFPRARTRLLPALPLRLQRPRQLGWQLLFQDRLSSPTFRDTSWDVTSVMMLWPQEMWGKHTLAYKTGFTIFFKPLPDILFLLLTLLPVDQGSDAGSAVHGQQTRSGHDSGSSGCGDDGVHPAA